MAAKIDDKKKLNYEEGEKLAFEKMLSIRESDLPNGTKALQERRLGRSCIVVMCGRASRLEDNAPSLSYRNRSVTRLRTAIKNKGFIRHDFNEKITALSGQYPIAEKEVLSLCGLTYLEVQKCIDDVVTKLANRIF